MIVADPGSPSASSRSSDCLTLDGLLRRAALRRPDAVALLDPPDRERFTDGRQRRLNYRQADRIVDAISARLRQLGLQADAIVALQVANTVESVLTLLGVLRAGLIAMPLPLLWRRAEMVAALRRVGPQALIVSGRIGATSYRDLAMEVAAEIFPVRYVCGYGPEGRDGFIPFADLFAAHAFDSTPLPQTRGAHEAEAHLAVITWDVTAAGAVPVARNHCELIAAGVPVVIEGHLKRNATILSTLTMGSFAGLAVGMVPWLLLDGTLGLHQPFHADVLHAQSTTYRPDAVIVPGPLAAQLVESGHLVTRDGLCVIGVWRAPERLRRALPWRKAETRMVDIQIFGEVGLIAATRAPGGSPRGPPFAPVYAPRESGDVIVAEISATRQGTLAMRGRMLPHAPFPPGAEHGALPCLNVDANGFVDTDYPCRSDLGALQVTGPPPGIVGVGGYRFLLRELRDLVSSAGDATLAVVPDALAGQRLAGSAPHLEAVRAALEKVGANPLVVGAFMPRTPAGGHRTVPPDL